MSAISPADKVDVRRSRARRAFLPGVALLAVVTLATPGLAQGRIANAKNDTRSAAQGRDREIRAGAARSGATWIGYRVPMIAGPRHMCCYDSFSDSGTCCGMCRLESGSGVSMTNDSPSRAGSRIMLEPPSEFIVMARIEGGVVGR